MLRNAAVINGLYSQTGPGSNSGSAYSQAVLHKLSEPWLDTGLGGLEEARPGNVLNVRFSIITWEPWKRGQPAAFHPFIGELDLCFL